MNVLCFESGGTKLVAAVADGSGRILDRKILARRPEQRAEETLDALASMGREFLRKWPCRAVGFGFGGTVRRSDGIPLHCYHEAGWGTLDAAARLQNDLGLPVAIENDCNLAALAEAWAVPGGPPGCLFYVTLGTGVGGGVVRGGHLVRLGDVGEAEIGHLVVEPDGFPCPCGNRGCLEMYCSGPGIAQLAESMLDSPQDPRRIMESFRRGDEAALQVVSEAAGYMARGLAACINLFAAERVILGGGVMKANRPFLDLVREKTLPLVFPPFRDKLTEIGLSRCGTDVVCKGAALFAIQRSRAAQG